MIRITAGVFLALFGIFWGFSPSDTAKTLDEKRSVEVRVPIAETVVGDRLLAANPQIFADERNQIVEPDFGKWFQVRLESMGDENKIEVVVS